MEGAPLLAHAKAAELTAQPRDQQWLVESLWARSAVGVIGGAPKCCKSWLGLDLAVSVAWGTDALGCFAVQHAGPALVYLAEDALPQVRERIAALCRGRGLDIAALDLTVITEPTLRLDLERDVERLANTLERLRPRLLVLDPLVRLHRLDENSAAEVSGLLGAIRELQRRFDVAIALVHHASKKVRAQPGQALRGSGDLHAIGDSNLYLARPHRGLVLTVEQRAAAPLEPMQIELWTDAERGAARLRVVGGFEGAGRNREALLDDAILDALAEEAPLTRAALRTRLQVNNERLGEVLLRMEQQRRIVRSATGWSPNEIPGETQAGSAGAQPAEG